MHLILNLTLSLLLFILPQHVQGAAHKNHSQIFLLNAALPSNAELFATMQKEWSIPVKDVAVTQGALSFSIPTGTVQYRLIEKKMPESEWLAFASIAWLWKSAQAEMQGHTAYLDVQFTANTTATAYQAELELAKVNASLLHTMPNNAIGILNADSYLLLDRNLYRETMKHLPEGEAPAYLMVYFGMAEEKNRHSGYTYGLYRFNLPEVEIVGSERSLHEVHGVLLQSVNNLLANGNLAIDAKAKESNPKVSVSDGVYVQGQTMKIQF